eukprot:1279496-Rhodomonas_salina.1
MLHVVIQSGSFCHLCSSNGETPESTRKWDGASSILMKNLFMANPYTSSSHLLQTPPEIPRDHQAAYPKTAPGGSSYPSPNADASGTSSLAQAATRPQGY